MSELAIAIAANVALGAVMLALLLRRRGREPARLSGPDEAFARFAAHFPDAAGTVVVAADGKGALFDLHDGTVGLLELRGRRWNARRIEAADLAAARAVRGEAIELRFADFAWPRARIVLADAHARVTWLARLAALKPGGSRLSPADPGHA